MESIEDNNKIKKLKRNNRSTSTNTSSKTPSCNGDIINKKVRKRTPRDGNAPKPPMSAYVFYIRESTKSCKNTGDFKECAFAWRTMTDEQKKPYIEKATADSLKYRKEMDEYKKSDGYRQYLNEKKSINKNNKTSSCLEVNGVQIFSKEFLELNKMRETSLRKLRREIGDVEEETDEMEQKINLINKDFDNTQKSAYELETQYNNTEKLLEKWRKITLKALEEAKLLSYCHLSLNSNMNDLVSRLEEAAKKNDSFTNLLKSCLLSINYSS